MELVFSYDDNTGGDVDEFVYQGKSIEEVFKSYDDETVKKIIDIFENQQVTLFLDIIDNRDFKNISLIKSDDDWDEDDEEDDNDDDISYDCAPGMDTFWRKYYSNKPDELRIEIIKEIAEYAIEWYTENPTE